MIGSLRACFTHIPTHSHELVASFLVADGITHGLGLETSPPMQFLYFVCNIGVVMAPLSNAALCIRYLAHPCVVSKVSLRSWGGVAHSTPLHTDSGPSSVAD